MADCTCLEYGLGRVGNTSDEFAAFIKKEMVKWAKVVKESGAKVD